MIMLGKLEPTETVRLDNIRLDELYQRLGPISAENVISCAMEELAVRLSRISKAYKAGNLDDVRRIADSLGTIADQVGMPVLGRVAANVADLCLCNDGAALAATMSRLIRLGEKSLMAVWDLQDLSV